MKTITKTVKKYGNSGGVYLPASWIGGRVKFELVEEPLDPKKELLSLPLGHVISVILYGSYARGEMTHESDIDVIVVTDEEAKINISPELKERYDIRVRSASRLRNSVEHDSVFYKVIKDESVALFNQKFLEDLKKIQPKASDIKFRLDMTESSLNIVKTFISVDANPADLVYPLILRLKEILFIECFLANKIYTTALLKKEILGYRVSASEFETLLSIYRAVRADKAPKGNISMITIEKLASLLETKILHVKQKTLKKRH